MWPKSSPKSINFLQSKEDRDFDQAILKISSLPVDEQYEQKAIDLYGDFLEKYPNSRYQQRIVSSLGDIKNLVDQYYYEELKRAARMDFSQRLQVYKSYLKRFPGGRYQGDVDTLMNEMGQQHLNYLKTEDAKCEQTQRWETCVQRYDRFIAEFQGTPWLKPAARCWRSCRISAIWPNSENSRMKPAMISRKRPKRTGTIWTAIHKVPRSR